jgi:hypothetical protein
LTTFEVCEVHPEKILTDFGGNLEDDKICLDRIAHYDVLQRFCRKSVEKKRDFKSGMFKGFFKRSYCPFFTGPYPLHTGILYASGTIPP